MPDRLLLVEDTPSLSMLYKSVLTRAGHGVACAFNLAEARAHCERARPPLVLLDLQLPGIDGHETLRRLRAGVLPDRVPVVAVTALAMAEDRDRAQRAGFDGYLEKPISPRSLPAQVERFLNGGGS